MATKQKEVTTLDVQIAEFIRNHKQTGVATDDNLSPGIAKNFVNALIIKIFLFFNKETVFSFQFSINSIKASSTKILVFFFSQVSIISFISSC